jgi:hypothetical protein
MSGWEVWNPAGTDNVSGLTVLTLALSNDWCMVRTPPPLLSPIWGALLAYLNRVQCHNSSVPWIAIAQTCGSLSGSHSSTPFTSTSPFLQLPTRKSKHATILGCHAASFCQVPWLPRVVFQLSLERLWPPGNWSSLPSDHRENLLIWVDSSLIVPLGLSLREYSSWAVSGNLSSFTPGHHKNHLTLVDLSLMTSFE